MQTCNERDKQVKIIEELTQKFLNSENEKHEIEHWVSASERHVSSLLEVTEFQICFVLKRLTSKKPKWSTCNASIKISSTSSTTTQIAQAKQSWPAATASVVPLATHPRLYTWRSFQPERPTRQPTHQISVKVSPKRTPSPISLETGATLTPSSTTSKRTTIRKCFE